MTPRPEPWDIRQELEGRPALSALLGLVVGLTAVSHPVNLLALGLLFWTRSLRGRCWCAAAFLVGLALAPTPPTPLTSREFLKDSGQVTSGVRHEGSEQRCQIDVSRGTFSLLLVEGPRLRFGDQIQVQGVASPIAPSEDRFERQLLAGTLRAGPGDIAVTRSGGPVSALADEWRSSFEKSLEPIPKEAAAVIEASVFGVDDVSPIVTQHLRAAGAISIASVSGLQVLILSSLYLAAAGRVPLPRGAALVILAAILALFATACGLHAGVLRACLMSVILSAAYLFRRNPDILSALALAAVFELLWRPSWVFDFGFQVSFLVVATLALWMPKRSRVIRRPPLVRVGWFLGGLAALFLAAAPMVAYETGELTVLSPLLGALIVPVVAPMFTLGLAGWLLGVAWPAAGAAWMSWLAAPLAGWVLVCSDLGTGIRGLTVEIPPFSAYWLVPFYALVVYAGRYPSSAFAGERR